MGLPPSDDDPRGPSPAPAPPVPAAGVGPGFDEPVDGGVGEAVDAAVAAEDASFGEDDDAPPSQPVEGDIAVDPPASRPAPERFAWLPYAVLGVLVLLGVAGVLGTLLR